MASFSGLGIGLSFLFGFILIGVFVEIYYLLYWKRKALLDDSSTNIEKSSALFCWKKRSSFIRQELTNLPDLESGDSNSKNEIHEEDTIETELMRVHNLCGPPRFLYTIKEENKEDLESVKSSRKGSRATSLSEFVTPLSSPSVKISQCLDSYSNPLFESITDAELNGLRSSPPPKFKFLKDAEDKLLKKLLMEEIERKRVKKSEVQASQVLPLDSSSPMLNPVLESS